MAVSQCTRFEVLRRDAHTCRYCGSSAPDVKLTVETAMAARWVDDRFSYCMGVCRNVVSERADIARSLMGGE